MTRKKPELARSPGQDSFLDVVTNLIGIMIIIIMVIGTRATDAMVDATAVVKPGDEQVDLADGPGRRRGRGKGHP